jgi:hypothetical protein
MLVTMAANSGMVMPESRGLSEVERVVDTFVAPSKTFHDILRSASWWMPFVLMIVFSLATSYVVDKQVGFERVTETQIHNSPKQEDALNQMTPDQRAQRMSISVKMTKIISYGIPVFLLLGFAIYALILWASFNFVLGSSTTFWQVFAVCFYASLPYLLLNVLTILTIYFGGNPEAYDFKNPVGTNIGYYMSESAPWLKALLGRFDLIQLWTVGLVTYGMSIIAKKTIAQSAMVVLGLWLLMTIVTVGGAAFS